MPGCGPVLDPQAQFQQCRVPHRRNVRPQRHLDSSRQRRLEGTAVLVCGGFSPDHQTGRQVLAGGVGLLVLRSGEAGGQLADAESWHIPGAAADEIGDALLVRDVGMLHAVSAQLDGHLHRLGIRGVGHDLEIALTAEREGGLDLLGQQERLGVPVPPGAHDSARQVELDVVYVVLHLVADGLGVAVGAVALPGVPGGQEVAAGGGQKIAAGEDPRPGRSRSFKGPAPGHVHEMARSAAAHAGYSSLDQASL